jgi:hypothetical protein
MDSFLEQLIHMKKSIESEMQSLTYMIQEKKDHIRCLNDYIYEHCEHEWVNDIIDLIERSQKITYCKHCESSK